MLPQVYTAHSCIHVHVPTHVQVVWTCMAIFVSGQHVVFGELTTEHRQLSSSCVALFFLHLHVIV